MAIKLRAQSDKLKGDIREAKRTLGELGGAVGTIGTASVGAQGALLGLAKNAKGFAAAAAAAAAAWVVFKGTRFAIGAAADLEQARVAMTNLTGSAEHATRILAEVNQFAARTPFENQELVRTTNKLLAFGFSADEVVSQLKLLADISAGSGANIFELATTFGQARAEGVALTRDLRELTNRAVPILDVLKEQVGLTGEEFQKFVEGRGVKFDVLQQALEKLAGTGGKFANATAKQSQTLNGLLSTLKGEFGLLAAELGQVVLPILKQAVKWLIWIVRKLRDMAEWFGITEKKAVKAGKVTSVAVKQVAEVAEESSEAVDAAAKRMQELSDRAAQIFDNTRTPMERAKRDVAELRELFELNLITLDTYNRAVADIVDGLDKAKTATSALKQAQGTGIATRKSGGFSAIQEQQRHLQFLADKKREELRLAEKRNELLVELGVKLDGLSRGGQRINVQQVRL